MSSNEWKKVKLDDISLKITKGTTPSTIGSSFTSEGINFYRAECVTAGKYLDTSKRKFINKEAHEKMKRSQLNTNDILFSMAGMFLGKTCIVTKADLPANINQAIAIIRINSELANYNYVYYFLNQKIVIDYVNNTSAQSAQPNINLKQIGELYIALPPLAKQKAIADVLSMFDEKIETNNNIIFNLKQLAETIFKRWFIDFEYPNEKEADYKSSGGEMVESELGMIPKPWEVLEMGDFLTLKTKRVGDLDVTEYSTTNSGIQLRDEKFKKNLSKSSAKNKVIEKNDIVFGMSRQILNFGVMKDKIGSVSGAYHVFSVDCKTYDAELLEMYMRIRADYFLSLIKPGAREGQGIDKKHLQTKKIVVPSKEIQEKFLLIYSSIKENINSLSKEINLLTEMKNTLLPKFLSGEIDISTESEEKVHV